MNHSDAIQRPMTSYYTAHRRVGRRHPPRDPMSCSTHFWGAVASVIGTVLFWVKSQWISHNPIGTTLSLVVFGLSLVALYSASAYYHYYAGDPKTEFRLRKLDHSMIYVLIAGSYTPICVQFLDESKRIPFLLFIWSFAIIGIVIKCFWFQAPRWLYTSIYLLMGWSLLIDLPGFLSMGTGALALLAAGGILYTIGGVIYMIKKPNLPQPFGFHEIFHIFVLLGSLMHFLTAYLYIAC